MRDLVLQRRAKVLRSNSTDAERHLWRGLRGRQLAGHRFRRQVPLAGYVADFACLEAGLIVELDGSQHLERRYYDARRERATESGGISGTEVLGQ